MDYKLGVFAATIIAAVGAASGAWAADAVVTKAPPAGTSATPSASAPKTCTGVWDFIETDCQLTWHGITLYGAIDAGFGYQTHGAPLDRGSLQTISGSLVPVVPSRQVGLISFRIHSPRITQRRLFVGKVFHWKDCQ